MKLTNLPPSFMLKILKNRFNLLLLLSFLIYSQAYAQSTITLKYNPPAGNTYRYHTTFVEPDAKSYVVNESSFSKNAKG